MVGETPNLAARLQALAQPNTIVIDERTRRLTGRLFECEDLGMQELKGFAKPLRAWRVLARSAVDSRFEALHSADLPLVNRHEEFDLLLRRWNQAKSGEGQVVLLSGEAGIGKSRLGAELKVKLRDEPHVRLHYSCSPQHQGSALYPVISQLMRAGGIAGLDSDEQKFDKLRSLLARFSDRRPHRSCADRRPAVDLDQGPPSATSELKPSSPQVGGPLPPWGRGSGNSRRTSHC